MKITDSFVLVILFTLLVPVCLFSQSEYLDNGVNGTGLSVHSYWDSGEFRSVGFSGAFSLAGILDLGLGVDISLGATREVSGFILYNVFLLKQERQMPISFQIIGTYGFTNVSSYYRDSKYWIRRGSGFTIGAKLFRIFMISAVAGIRPGIFSYYKSYRFVTEEESQWAEAEFERYVEVEDNIYYGAFLSLLFKTSNSGPIISTTFEGMMDPDFNISFGPKLNITLPSE